MARIPCHLLVEVRKSAFGIGSGHVHEPVRRELERTDALLVVRHVAADLADDARLAGGAWHAPALGWGSMPQRG